MSTRLPRGTVTFLFTDIEGSTRLVAEVGDAAYSAVLDAERTPDPALRAAAAEGEAWSREDAVDRAIALLDEVAAGRAGG